MNEEKGLKDKFFENNPNWITDEGFEKLKVEMGEKFPEIEISKDSKFIMLKKGGRELRLHRWHKFNYAPDGHHIEGQRTIEQEIEKFAKESE